MVEQEHGVVTADGGPARAEQVASKLDAVLAPAMDENPVKDVSFLALPVLTPDEDEPVDGPVNGVIDELVDQSNEVWLEEKRSAEDGLGGPGDWLRGSPEDSPERDSPDDNWRTTSPDKELPRNGSVGQLVLRFEQKDRPMERPDSDMSAARGLGLSFTQPPSHPQEPFGGTSEDGLSELDDDLVPRPFQGVELGPSSEDCQLAVIDLDGGPEPGHDVDGDMDRGHRAQDLISRELLDELEPEDTSPLGGPPLGSFDTDSEPEHTPKPDVRYFSPSHGHDHFYNGQNNDAQLYDNDGLMCRDEWDWKTEAPEFVPGSMKGVAAPSHDTLSATTADGSSAGNAGGATKSSNTWAPVPALPATQRPQQGFGWDSNTAPLSQMHTDFEWQLHAKTEECREMQGRMHQLEIETAQVRASWEHERRGLVRQISNYRTVLERYCIPLEEAEAGVSHNNNNTREQKAQYFNDGHHPSHHASQWSNGALGPGHGKSGNFTSGGASPSQGPRTAPPHLLPASQRGGQHPTPPLPPPPPPPPPPPAHGQSESNGNAAPGSTLDFKMRQLNSLLQEGQSTSNHLQPGPGNGDGAPEARVNGSARDPRDERVGKGNGKGDARSDARGDARGTKDKMGVHSPREAGAIVATLRAMFPHAAIRTREGGVGGQEGAIEVDGKEISDEVARAVQKNPDAEISIEHGLQVRGLESHVRRLEKSAEATIDERAMRALLALPRKDAREALSKVDEVVYTQGGHCRNLSSILQSLCRKIEKRTGPGPLLDGVGGQGARDTRGKGGQQGTWRARRLDEEKDAFDYSSESDGEGGMKLSAATRSSTWPQATADHLSRERNSTLDTPLSKCSIRSSKSWADIQSGDEEEGGGHVAAGPPGDFGKNSGQEREDPGDHWTTFRVEKAAKRGFELRRRGEHWDLKISMGSLEPRLTEAGMERYCRWLRGRLKAFREQHGWDSLRRCRGEVDFSHNALSNEMVWMLLETLAQHEVHTALLKLFANHISQGGVLAICEFIRMNERAEPLQELHLSHNEIDDEAVLELIRTLESQRPKYPPRRLAEGSGERSLAPVWLRLNHNRIRNPTQVLQTVEGEGINVCTASDRNACGTSKCCRRDCPLVHLYAFSVQDVRLPPASCRREDRNSRPRRHHGQVWTGHGGGTWSARDDGWGEQTSSAYYQEDAGGEGRSARRRRGKMTTT